MENKKYYELDKVQSCINCSLDNKDNNMSTYIYNYARILEAFIKDINDLKNKENNNRTMLEEFDIIDKFKKLITSEADRCIILNRLASSQISDTKSDKENTKSNNTMDLNELINEIVKNNKNYDKFDNNVTKQKVNEPIKPKTIRPKEDYINKVNLSSVYGICENSDILNDFENSKTSLRNYMINHDINKEDNPLDNFEFVAETFARLVSKFNNDFI